jgi:IMP dehydrogenase
MAEMLSWIKDRVSPDTNIMVGNVATGDGYKFLADRGADAIRVGIGGGSICKTRIMTGFGVPTLASVADCYKAKLSGNYNSSIIADGGIRYPSDLVKSLAFGADAIMAGRIFAGTLESPGETVIVDGVKSKTYRGMASREVQEDKRGGLKPGTCAEGVSTHIPIKGKARYILEEFSGGLRSAMTYCNARDIAELRENVRFIRMSPSSLDESHAFGTKV